MLWQVEAVYTKSRAKDHTWPTRSSSWHRCLPLSWKWSSHINTATYSHVWVRMRLGFTVLLIKRSCCISSSNQKWKAYKTQIVSNSWQMGNLLSRGGTMVKLEPSLPSLASYCMLLTKSTKLNLQSQGSYPQLRNSKTWRQVSSLLALINTVIKFWRVGMTVKSDFGKWVAKHKWWSTSQDQPIKHPCQQSNSSRMTRWQHRALLTVKLWFGTWHLTKTKRLWQWWAVLWPLSNK